MHCHCSICRKTGGSGGFGINLGARFETLKVTRRAAPRPLSRAHPRARQAHQALEGRAPLLHGVRQPALALGPALARARPSACLGDRHAAAEAGRGGRGGAGLCGRAGSTCRAARATSTAGSGRRNRSTTGTDDITCSAADRRARTRDRRRPRARLAGAGAEDRAADAHHRRALGDRRLEIGAHAHRQGVERRGLRRAASRRARAGRGAAARCAVEVAGAARGSPSGRAGAAAAAPRRHARCGADLGGREARSCSPRR